MSKHTPTKNTPAPWIALKQDSGLWQVRSQETNHRVASDLYEGDAKQIAAAPDLLAGCKAFVRWVAEQIYQRDYWNILWASIDTQEIATKLDDCWGASHVLSPETLAEYERAKAAIAKAEGCEL